MKILITGICGFTGSALARWLPEHIDGLAITGIDNMLRAGAHINQAPLLDMGVDVRYGDIRSSADLEGLPAADWIIDAAACPSVLAGVEGRIGSRQLIEHNLLGTINLLELCRRHGSGLVFLSSSRVYSIAALCALPMKTHRRRFIPAAAALRRTGISAQGINENFCVAPPRSLYGSAKYASENLAREYAAVFDFPLIVNRCGVLAGAGQFARIDQGIFAYWIHSCRGRRPPRFMSFGGRGLQVRDSLHPRDLADLLARQIRRPPAKTVPLNVGGGLANSTSLAELDAWCRERFGTPAAGSCPENRTFDVPWLVMDSAAARKQWRWQPRMSLAAVLDEIADHADRNPQWLEMTCR